MVDIWSYSRSINHRLPVTYFLSQYLDMVVSQHWRVSMNIPSYMISCWHWPSNVSRKDNIFLFNTLPALDFEIIGYSGWGSYTSSRGKSFASWIVLLYLLQPIFLEALEVHQQRHPLFWMHLPWQPSYIHSSSNQMLLWLLHHTKAIIYALWS